MDNKPFFSIIITTFNRANIIERSLNSLLNQFETDWEAIIIDDGSTDNTKEKIKKYLSNNIKYFFQNNLGAANAKNTGIELSSGKYITFLDSDDEYKENHLYVRKKFLEQFKCIEFLYGGVEIIGNQFVPDIKNPTKKIHLSDCVIGGSFFIKKEIIKLLNGFPVVEFGEDKLLFDKAKNLNLFFANFMEQTYIYHRDTKNSTCNNLIK